MVLLGFKIFKLTISKAKKTPTNICKISFRNKGEKVINISHIIYDTSVKACLPTDIKFDDPTVVYLLKNQIRSKIVLLSLFLIWKALLQDNTILPYNCAGSGFIEKDHRNIVTRDLQILGNNLLRKLFTKDTKYRESNNTSWKKAKSAIIDGLNNCIDT